MSADFKKVNCGRCGESFETEVSRLGTLSISATVCDSCLGDYEAERVNAATEQAQKEREASFMALCPEKMRALDLGLFPAGIEKYQKCMAEALKNRGLIIHGKTATGKSRMLWQLARRIIVKERRTAIVVRDVQFGRMIERSYQSNTHDALIRKLSQCSVLMIDDLGKSKLTQRVETDLFDIIDSRYNSERPVVYTTQFTGESLTGRFNAPETADAIIRRIRQECESISFKNSTESK